MEEDDVVIVHNAPTKEGTVGTTSSYRKPQKLMWLCTSCYVANVKPGLSSIKEIFCIETMPENSLANQCLVKKKKQKQICGFCPPSSQDGKE